jgi:NADPH:quinone reductase-like Zn-dependent oxidoreductase
VAGIGATRFKPGDGVFGYTSLMRDGAYAEWMVARETELALAPASLEFTHAAALPVSSLTAWQSLFDTAKLSKGQTVLVHAAAGGVGSVAVQLAAWKGAKVIGTASATNADFVRRLGASTVIDYAKTPFETVARDVDVVFATRGGEVLERSWGVLKRGGVLVSIVDAPSEERAKQHGVRAASVYVKPNSTQLAEIARLVDDGKLAAQVEKVLPLGQARQAHELSRTGHTRGKIVLVPGP